MEVSLFLARFLGLYLLIVSSGQLIRRDKFTLIIKDYLLNPGLLLLSGILALIFGLVIVLAHPTLEANWRGLITLLGYLGIVKGVVLLWIPERMQQFVFHVVGPRYVIISAIVNMLIGIFLLHHGFLAHH